MTFGTSGVSELKHGYMNIIWHVLVPITMSNIKVYVIETLQTSWCC